MAYLCKMYWRTSILLAGLRRSGIQDGSRARCSTAQGFVPVNVHIHAPTSPISAKISRLRQIHRFYSSHPPRRLSNHRHMLPKVRLLYSTAADTTPPPPFSLSLSLSLLPKTILTKTPNTAQRLLPLHTPNLHQQRQQPRQLPLRRLHQRLPLSVYHARRRPRQPGRPRFYHRHRPAHHVGPAAHYPVPVL